MPRYKFHVYDGRVDVKPDEEVLRDVDAARREGIRRAGAALVLDAHTLRADTEWRLEVEDEHGLVLYRMDFSITASSAVAR